MSFRSKVCLSILAMSLFGIPAFAIELKEESVATKFKGQGPSCFELLDCTTGETFRYNKERCAKRLPPQSTFKIFNSMAGLDCGVLKDENHPMKWDGHKYELSPWNHDQTLKSAVKDSVVWYFQKVAEDIGEERMKKYVQSAHYGNEDITGGIKDFWIDKSLQISADEQVKFVKDWYFEKLPFSKRSMDITKKITEVKSTPKGELHGKTGTGGKDGKIYLGWFVGYIVHAGHPYAFATNISNGMGRKAREITESILTDAGLL